MNKITKINKNDINLLKKFARFALNDKDIFNHMCDKCGVSDKKMYDLKKKVDKE